MDRAEFHRATSVNIEVGHPRGRRSKRPSLADQAQVHADFARVGLPVDSTVILHAFRDRAWSHPHLDFGTVSEDPSADVTDQTAEQETEGDVKTQSSIVTVFAIWNTMMGSSLLCMPWAISRAGLVGGIIAIMIVGALCCYTAYRTYDSQRLIDRTRSAIVEFSDICAGVLGEWARYVESAASILPLLGAIIVFWVLMSTFSKNLAVFIYEAVSGNVFGTSDERPTVLCPKNSRNASDIIIESYENAAGSGGLKSVLDSDVLWSLALAVPLFPIVNIRDPSIFFKFSSLGTVSVIYLTFYVLFKSFSWGLHVDFSSTSLHYTPLLESTLPSLTGLLCVSYFLHNAVIAMLRYNRVQENNVRDLCVGYSLVGSTYLIIGVSFFITFPLDKSCIQDNFLNNFASTDILSIISRAFLLMQLMTLYPMISYIIRSQVLHALGDRVSQESRWPIFIVNLVLLIIAVNFAIFLRDVGDVLRYCGAVAGLLSVFFLPCVVYVVAMKKKGQLTVSIAVGHGLIVLAAFANFVLQFTE